MNTAQIENSLNISEKDLHSTLNDFLEENEKKPKQSIWNYATITGLILVLTSAAFVGYSIGTEFLGLSGLPFMNTAIKIAPYFGGALLATILISVFTSGRSKRKKEIKQEEVKIKETYDKLDDFLYSDEEKDYSSSTKSKTKKSTDSSFKVDFGNRLTRSRSDKKIAGVCGGLAKHLGMSSTVLRLIFVAAVFLSSSTFILVYIAMAIVMPKEPIDWMDDFN